MTQGESAIAAEGLMNQTRLYRRRRKRCKEARKYDEELQPDRSEEF
jgi:hypothetical protein